MLIDKNSVRFRLINGGFMKNTLLKLTILASLIHVPLTHSMECFTLETVQYAQWLTPKNIALGLGATAIPYLGYRLLTRSSESYKPQVIKLNKTDSQEAQAFINRFQQAITSKDTDFRFIYDYSVIWDKIGLPIAQSLIKAKNENALTFLPRGHVINDQGKTLFTLRGNVCGLEITSLASNYCIIMDIQGAHTLAFGSQDYKKMAQRHVAHYPGSLLQEFNQLLKQIKQEQAKPEHERNYAFVSQKLAQLNDSDRFLFTSGHIIGENGESLQEYHNVNNPHFDIDLLPHLH